jgi:phosphoribosylformylglycinamidine synthase
VTVAISESPSMMLSGMAGCTLGVWVAHGEGRAKFETPELKKEVCCRLNFLFFCLILFFCLM